MELMPVGREGAEEAQGEEVHEEPEVAEEQEEHRDDDGMGTEEEFQRPRVLRDPGQPSAAEIEEHNVTHIPYRPWCEACNRGKAKKKPAKRPKKK